MDLNHKFGWQDIEGWFGHSQIYDQIIREARKNETIIEIGSWLGKSSCYLASRAKLSGKNMKIICIDTFRKDSTNRIDILDRNIVAEFNEKMTKAGVIDCINLMITTSEIASHNLKNESVFAVFMDSSDDIERWYPKIKPEGILAGCDLSTNHSKRIFDKFGIKQSKENGTWMIRKPSVRHN